MKDLKKIHTEKAVEVATQAAREQAEQLEALGSQDQQSAKAGAAFVNDLKLAAFVGSVAECLRCSKINGGFALLPFHRRRWRGRLLEQHVTCNLLKVASAVLRCLPCARTTVARRGCSGSKQYDSASATNKSFQNTHRRNHAPRAGLIARLRCSGCGSLGDLMW